MRIPGTGKKRTLQDAIGDVRLSRPPKPKRKQKGKTAGGLERTSITISPRERAALEEMGRKNEVSVSVILRALIRLYQTVPIDRPEDSK